jgi:hypothetical protein
MTESNTDRGLIMFAFLIFACTVVWVAEGRVLDTIATIGVMSVISWIADPNNKGIIDAIVTSVIVTVWFELLLISIRPSFTFRSKTF